MPRKPAGKSSPAHRRGAPAVAAGADTSTVTGGGLKALRRRTPRTPGWTIAWMDIFCSGKELGKVHFELSDGVCPRTCANFAALCTGERGAATTGQSLHYKNTRLFRVVPGFVIQGGDVTRNNGSGGECIWARERPAGTGGARFFADENFALKHDRCGVLSMANEGPNTNQSQFFITCSPCPWLDGRNVAFGRVVRGFDVLAVIETMGTAIGACQYDIRINDCGVLDPEEPFECEALEVPTMENEERRPGIVSKSNDMAAK